MNRRLFLSTLAAGMTLDPERALWVKDRTVYSIPRDSHRHPALPQRRKTA